MPNCWSADIQFWFSGVSLLFSDSELWEYMPQGLNKPLRTRKNELSGGWGGGDSICPVWMKMLRLAEGYVWCGNEWFRFSGLRLVMLYSSPHLLPLLLLFRTSADGFDRAPCSHVLLCWIVFIWAAMRLFNPNPAIFLCCFLWFSSGKK